MAWGDSQRRGWLNYAGLGLEPQTHSSGSYLSDGSRHGYTISDPTDAYFRAEPARRAEHSSISGRISGGAPRDDVKPSSKVQTTKYRSIPSSARGGDLGQGDRSRETPMFAADMERKALKGIYAR